MKILWPCAFSPPDKILQVPKLFLSQGASWFSCVCMCVEVWYVGCGMHNLQKDFIKKCKCNTCRTLQCGALFVPSIFGRQINELCIYFLICKTKNKPTTPCNLTSETLGTGFNDLYPECLKKALLLWKYIYIYNIYIYSIYKYFYFLERVSTDQNAPAADCQSC